MPETEALATRVRAFRTAIGKSQEELAAEIGISTEELSLIERRRTDVKLSTLKKIAACTGYTVSELIEVTNYEIL